MANANRTGSPDGYIPARTEDGCCLLPTEPFGPSGKEDAITVRRTMLAISPGHLLDGDTTARATNAPHTVEEEHGNRPQRDELEPSLTKRIVSWAFAAATAANRPAPAVRVDLDEDFTTVLGKTGATVDETLLLFDAVEDSLELHLVCCEVDGLCGNTINTPSAGKMHFFRNKSGSSCLRRSRPSVAHPGAARHERSAWRPTDRAQMKSSGCLCW